jgi:hypothetical protein
MFDTGCVNGRVGVSELKANVGLPAGAGFVERRLPVIGPLAPLLPEGLERGSTVLVAGSTALALALVAGLGTDGGWVAGVGWGSVGLMAAHELGVEWERLVVVNASDQDAWSTVLSAVVDAFDVVLVRSSRRVAASDARRLAARARERGTVLVVADAPSSTGESANDWPVPVEARLRVVESRWVGLGDGHGYLQGRRVVVQATGRGRLSRPRQAGLWLPADTDRIDAGRREDTGRGDKAAVELIHSGGADLGARRAVS